MPRNTREWALRELDAACNNISWVEKHLLKVVDKYIELHPEIAYPLNQLLEVSAMLEDSIKSVRSSI